MATSVKPDDQIVAGPAGATLYGDRLGNPWIWEGQSVRLEANDFLFTTGKISPDALQGPVYEVYIWRFKGAKRFWRTERDARKGDGLIVNLSKLAYEIRYILVTEAIVTNDPANEKKQPNAGSPISQEESQKKALEERLKREIYDVNPSQPQHTSLVKNPSGEWILNFQNGYSTEVNAFFKLLPDKRLTLTTAKPGKDGFGDGSGKGDGDDDKKSDAIPTWVYVLLGGISVIGFVFLIFQKQGKTKK